MLAAEQGVQDRLRNEIVKAQADSGTTGDLPYDIIMGLPLLDAVVREALRLYAPVPQLFRQYAKKIHSHLPY